ncbi:MAG: pyridoxal phosphate-dependent aminotransferase [Deltaproteobacteria bacterium]|nr:pyridoxal phosphate-dependent aminotransferase [Deltaproteobacteria bacterium]MBW2067521.1 pyridoxal phosphate-dependent aminotransferase [Deltaproteobacteria bacterium]
MSISSKMAEFMERSSWIRKMFEEGAKLKAIYGSDKVCDFSLGNPNVYPPPQVHEELVRIAQESTGASHGYMPNAGYPEVRHTVANYLASEHGMALSEEEIIMTCGAAGGINVVLKAILNPGDEVIVPAPFFVEYGFYIDNHGGVIKSVPTNPDFTLSMDAIQDSITSSTKAVLINSPNNPTGQVYGQSELEQLADVLTQKSKAVGHTIYLISDEPYRRIVFDGIKVPSILKIYSESFVVTSYSKDLCLPGERIGYIVVNPEMSEKKKVIGALILANRILGFVNAPALMQRLVARLQGISIDAEVYRKKRDHLLQILSEIGYECVKPGGAFYLFPKSPISDDVKFVQMLQEELVLVVPGSGFGGPGHFRIAYCVDDETIERSAEGFRKAFKKAKTL